MAIVLHAFHGISKRNLTTLLAFPYLAQWNFYFTFATAPPDCQICFILCFKCKGKPIIQREEYVTTEVTANALAAAVGTELGVGTGGTLATIADLSVANLDAFQNTFVIIKKVKLNLVDALIVQAKVKA